MFEVVGDGSDFSAAVEEQRETRLLINALFGRAWSGRYSNHAFQSASLYPGRKRRRMWLGGFDYMVSAVLCCLKLYNVASIMRS
jgi:hypothetical protein